MDADSGVNERETAPKIDTPGAQSVAKAFPATRDPLSDLELDILGIKAGKNAGAGYCGVRRADLACLVAEVQRLRKNWLRQWRDLTDELPPPPPRA